jgi:hypothetical protein
MSSPMTATLRKVESSAANESFTPEHSSREETMMIAEHASGPLLEPHDAPDRRLRNYLIIANAVAWVVIIVLIRLMFF